MLKIDFNSDWRYKRLGEAGDGESVALPHDAMIAMKRLSNASDGAKATCPKEYNYEYTKVFTLPEEYREKQLTFEFQGVYHSAEVYINGKRAMRRPYGYTEFYIKANAFLNFGGENELKVIARGVGREKDRRCFGAGICRPVYLYLFDRERIRRNGIHIRTLQIHPALVEVAVQTIGLGEVQVEFLYEDEVVFSEKRLTTGPETIICAKIPYAALWSPKNPSLYTCRVAFGQDVREEKFGIRTISCNKDVGFTLNGERTLIRGACIRPADGILGACAYPEWEERKIRALKSSGYNAVRSVHVPCSKSMLEVCDRLGMLVLDEYSDQSYSKQIDYGFGDRAQAWYEEDLVNLIEKDYNHPSVVMYSLGSEVTEAGKKRDVEFFRNMKDVCAVLDPDRPVTLGINLSFNYLNSLGIDVYAEHKGKENRRRRRHNDFFRELAETFGTWFMQTLALLPGSEHKVKDYFAVVDVAGYSYGIKRYKTDLEKYPDRIILGTETFCSDAYAFWELAKDNPRLIGDFVWIGGRSMIGNPDIEEENDPPMSVFLRVVERNTAGSGRLDLIGAPLGEALYTKVAFEREDRPLIAVAPGNAKKKFFAFARRSGDTIPSWSWSGMEGKEMRVEVYSRAAQVVLYVNGIKVGAKRFGKNCLFEFRINYCNGEITAVALDAAGKELSRSSLRSAAAETNLSLMPEKMEVKPGEMVFIPLKYTDKNYNWKPLENGTVQVTVEGGELLALGNTAPFEAGGHSVACTATYYGAALAVVRAREKKLLVTATDGKRTGRTEIAVRNRVHWYF